MPTTSAPSFEVDHLFILVAPGAPELRPLLDVGLLEGAPNEHPGQGTACRRVFFGNSYLELLWVADEQDARSHGVAPLKLWERWRGRAGAASPFGVCLRPAAPTFPQPGTTPAPAAPFPTFDYRPPYLPPGAAAIRVATSAAQLREPFLFFLSGTVSPAEYAADRRQPLDHPAGPRQLTDARLVTASAGPPSAPLRALQATGLVEIASGPAPLLGLTFDHAARNRSADLRPHLPLLLHW